MRPRVGIQQVSALEEGEGVSRRDRQRAELERLCEAGTLDRAVDLAFAHFADYGPDQGVLDALRAELDRVGAAPALRRRFGELCECR